MLDYHHSPETSRAQGLDPIEVVEGRGVGGIPLPFFLEVFLRLLEEFFYALGGIDFLVGGGCVIAHLLRC